ncbi:MAG: asparagine synthetase B [Candidatus Bathyarchaeia archaeon]
MRAIVGVLDKKGENAAQKVVAMLEALKHKGADAFTVASSDHLQIKTSLEQMQSLDFKTSVALGHVFLKVLAQEKPQLLMLKKARAVFDGRIYQPPNADLNHIAGRLGGKTEANAEAMLREFDGSFAFAIAEAERLIVGRDTLGLYPLYYSENEDLFAVASECKALWKIGLKEVNSFPPGHIAVIDKKCARIKTVKTLRSFGVHHITMKEAAEKLQRLLQKSVEERVSGLKEVAVAFSGGLDSSLTAFLAKKAGIKVNLIYVSLENQPQTEQAQEAAALLELPLHSYLYSENDVEKVLPKVLWAIESSDPVTTSIGVPVFWAAEKAAEMRFRVLLAGQGADELFGGYMRYLSVCLQHGEEAAQRKIFADILRIYETNFERDSKICSFHNIELRLPFATQELAEFALSLPLRLKIEPTKSTLRKTVLRKAAEKMGLPPQIVNKPKKAVQYSTGISKALKKIAKRNKLSLREYLQKVFQTSCNH